MSKFNDQEASSSKANSMQAQQNQTTGAVGPNTVNNASSPVTGAGKRNLDAFNRDIHSQENEEGKRQRFGTHDPTYGNAMPQCESTDAQAIPNQMSDLARRRQETLIRARAMPASAPFQRVGPQGGLSAPIGGAFQVPRPHVSQVMPMASAPFHTNREAMPMIPGSHPINRIMPPVPAPAPRNPVNPSMAITKDLVPPVPELSLSWPLPKIVANPAMRRSIRTSMVWNSHDPYPDNQRMVALRIEHEDLRYVDYTIEDMPILTMMLVQERVHKLNEALEYFMPAELRARRHKPLLNKKTKPSDDVKPVVAWCKEKESIQVLVNFWDSVTMIEMLKPFAATNRDLSIYDVIWLTHYIESRRRDGFTAERHLQLPLPPRMQGPALPPRKARNSRKTPATPTVWSAQPGPVLQPRVQPQQVRGHTLVSGQPQVLPQQQVHVQPQLPPWQQMPPQQQVHLQPPVIPRPQPFLRAQAPPQHRVSPPSQASVQDHVSQNLPLYQPAPKRPYVPDWLPPVENSPRIVPSMNPRQRFQSHRTASGAAQRSSQNQEPPRKKLKAGNDAHTEVGSVHSTPIVLQNVTNIPRNQAAETPVPVQTQEGQNHQPLSEVAKGKRPVENPGQLMSDFSMPGALKTTTHMGSVVASRGDQQQHQASALPPISFKFTKRKPEDDGEQSEEDERVKKMQKTQESPEAGDELFADLRNGDLTFEEMLAILHGKFPALTTPTAQGSEPQSTVASSLAFVNRVPQVLGQKSLFKVQAGEYRPERYNPQKPEEYRNMLAHTEPEVVVRVNPFTLGYHRVRRPRDDEYHALPEVRDVEALNRRLNSVLPRDTEAPQLLRNMPTPPARLFSQLTRCVRFAQSDAQRRVDWRLHPAHVYEIMQRSNIFGLELLISRSEIVVSSPATAEEFKMTMAMRLAHELFGKDPMMFVAADIPVLSAYLEKDIPSATLLTIVEDNDVFGDFVEELSTKFSEQYPPLNKSCQAAWMDLHSQVKIPTSLQAKVIELILKKISKAQDESEAPLEENIHQDSQFDANTGGHNVVNPDSSSKVLPVDDSNTPDSVAVDAAAYLKTNETLSNSNPEAAPLVDDGTAGSGAHSTENEAHEQNMRERYADLENYRKEHPPTPELWDPSVEENENTQASVSPNTVSGSGTEDVAPQAPQDDDSDGATLSGSTEVDCLTQPTELEDLQPQQSFKEPSLDEREAHRQWVMNNAGFGEFAAYPYFQPADDPGWNEWVQANNRDLFDPQDEPSNAR